GLAITVDSASNIYLTGETSSDNFPLKNPLQSSKLGFLDAFAAKFTADGMLAYSTYLGGSGDDSGRSIVVDKMGSAYIAGFTPSLDFPVANAFQPNKGGDLDAFIIKIAEPINSCPAIAISPGALSDATLGTFYSQKLSVNNAATAPIDFALTG